MISPVYTIPLLVLLQSRSPPSSVGTVFVAIRQHLGWSLGGHSLVTRASKVCEDFTITEKAPTRAFSWLKAPTSAFPSI